MTGSDRPSLSDWLTAVPGLQPHGSEHQGPCPACGGTDRFRVLADGAAFCRQCEASLPELLEAAGLSSSQRSPPRPLPRGQQQHREPTAVWRLRDPTGAVVAVHTRVDDDDGSKQVFWARPDGRPGLGGRTLKSLPLYGIHREAESRGAPVLVEGEKAADALQAAVGSQYLVLGTVTGAAATPAATVLAPLVQHALDHRIASPVLLWPDADPEGQRHMERIGRLLLAAGAQVRIIDWPSAPPHGDAADWVAAGQQPTMLQLREAATSMEAPAKEQPADAEQGEGEWKLLVKPRERLQPLPERAGENPADTLLLDLFGAPLDDDQDERLLPLAIHLLLGTAVRRAWDPGAKQDVTPVLIGRQGQGKSSLATCLLPRKYRRVWFGDGLRLSDDRKHVAEATSGRVIVELPDMAGMRKAELATLKSWLVSGDDGQHRGAYAEFARSRPRQWVGIGSCDRPDALPHDPDDQRRWLTIALGPRIVMNMDEAIDPLREQLWAHAVALYRDRTPTVPRELWDHVSERNRQHEVREQLSEDYAARVYPAAHPGGASLITLLTEAGVDQADWQRLQHPFSASLIAAGWRKERRRVDGRQIRIFAPPQRELFGGGA